MLQAPEKPVDGSLGEHQAAAPEDRVGTRSIDNASLDRGSGPGTRAKRSQLFGREKSGSHHDSPFSRIAGAHDFRHSQFLARRLREIDFLAASDPIKKISAMGTTKSIPAPSKARVTADGC
jgi:hypothetical protein